MDAALPSGYSSHLPIPWLAQELNLNADPANTGVWRNQKGEIVFHEFKGDEGGAVCLLRMDKAEEVIGDEYTLLTVFIAERNAWPGGSNSCAAWRRSEGVCWKDNQKMKALTWYGDSRNDLSNKKQHSKS